VLSLVMGIAGRYMALHRRDKGLREIFYDPLFSPS